MELKPPTPAGKIAASAPPVMIASALVAAKQAVEDAKLDGEDINKNRVGVIVAAGIGGLHTFEEEAGYYALHEDQGPKYNPFFIPKMIADIASGHISMDYGFHGPNFGTVSLKSLTSQANCVLNLEASKWVMGAAPLSPRTAAFQVR